MTRIGEWVIELEKIEKEKGELFRDEKVFEGEEGLEKFMRAGKEAWVGVRERI